MRQRLIVFLLAGAQLGATTVTVGTSCTPACDYTTLALALTARAGDCAIDTILLTSGQTFGGAVGTHWFDANTCGNSLLISVTRYAELPPIGTRISQTYVTNGITANLTNVNYTNPVVSFGSFEMLIGAVNTSTDKLTLTGDTHSIGNLAVGTPLSCKDTGNGLGPTANPQPGMPAPLQRFTKYYVVDRSNISSTQMDVKLSTTIGGTPIDLTNSSGVLSPSTNPYFQPQCSFWNNAANITLRGINIYAADPGVGNNIPIVMFIGLSENAQGAMVKNITIEQCLVWLGNATWRNRGLATAIQAGGVGTTIADSYIQAVGFNGQESHGITTLDGQTLTLRNNQVDSVGAAFFSGGSSGGVPQLNANGIDIDGNYFTLPGWMFTITSARLESTTPVDPCYYQEGTGGYFINQTGSPTDCTTGHCYTCQSNSTWAVDTAAVFRPYETDPKARVELKEGRNVHIHGNIIRGNVVAAESGNTGCIALPLVEQSLIDASGVYYYGESNVLVENNWCDRVFSGFLMGQTAAAVSAPAVNITNITVVDVNTYEITVSSSITNYFATGGSCPCPFFSGIVGSGNMQNLNGRFGYAVSSTGTTFRIYMNFGTLKFDATGTYTSGGTVQQAIWPSVVSSRFSNNLITRAAGTELSNYPTSGGVASRPLRQFNAHPGGAVNTKLTARVNASGAPYFAATFESAQFATLNFTYAQGILNNTILPYSATYAHPYIDTGLPVQTCAVNGYGGFYQSASAFSHALMAGANSAWPNPGAGCSDQSTLKLAASDAAVGYVGSDQSVITNSALTTASDYSSSNVSAVMLNTDLTDLGADIQAIAHATSGVTAGTAPWSVAFDAGSTKLVMTAQGQATWTLNLYNAPARISANLVGTFTDTITDGLRHQIVATGLSAGTSYQFLATDGTKTVVGTVNTVASGSGTYTYNFSGATVRYSASANMSSPTTATGGNVPCSSGSACYVDRGSGTSVYAIVAP